MRSASRRDTVRAMRFFIATSTLLFLATTAFANQAYIQARAWQVDRLPVLKGQAAHRRCIMQTGFSGTASMQYIADTKRLRGAVIIVTEPIFKEAGRDLDITLTAGREGFEFPAKTLSKYSIAIEISDVHEAAFRAALAKTDQVLLQSGFNRYSFAIQPVEQALEDALACTPPPPPPPEKLEPSPAMKATLDKIASMSDAPATPPVSKTNAATNAAPAVENVVADPLVKEERENAPRQNVVIGADKQKISGQSHFVKTGGTNVALSDALPMILPPNYKVNYAQGASAGERITWNAGGEWLETLVVALDDVSLQAAATGTTVTILPKIRPVAMAVTSTAPSERAHVIVKENAPDSMMRVTDPSKPPSPGMLDEADAMLASIKQLNEDDLWALNNASSKMQPILDDVPMPEKVAVDVEPAMKRAEPQDKVDTVLAVKEPTPEPGIEPDISKIVFTAAKGETVREVLARWGQQANAETEVDMKRDYYVGKDVRVQGDLDAAVAALLAQFDDLAQPLHRLGGEAEVEAGMSVSASLDDTGGASGSMGHAVAKAAPVSLTPPEPDAVEQRLGLVAQWSAVKGTSLRAAMSNWARQAQMQLVWEGAEDVQVAGHISGARRLEDALDTLLSGYDQVAQKPSIQINRDPYTGTIAMIVDVQPFAVVPKGADDGQ